MAKISILGAGRVGSAMALDMAKVHDVLVADQSEEALNNLKEKNPEIKTLIADLSKKEEIQKATAAADLVISAVPGFMGYSTLETIIRNEKDVVDISFFPEDAMELNTLAKTRNVTAVVDCGVAPGMDNILLGYWNKQMDVQFFECLVGGLPEEKKWPFNYKAPFSPIDVIEEYTRPARLVENGTAVIKPPLSEVEVIDFPGIGELEAFNSDGLRSLIQTMPNIPNMKEKTLRYPGHAQNIMVLKESGFFEEKPIRYQGQEIRPIDFTSKILFNEWLLKPGDREFTAMRVIIRGEKEGKPFQVSYHLLDKYNEQTQTSSMARTTGYTATAAANLLVEGLYSNPGINPPEYLGAEGDATLEYILGYLEEREIIYQQEES